MNASASGLATSPTITIQSNAVVEPEFALLRPAAIKRVGLPRESDVLWTIEVSVTSRRKDLMEKKAAYAAAGIPHYWVFDGVRGGVWTFAGPVGREYAQESFVSAGEAVTFPILGGELDTGAVFPPI